MGHYCGNVGRDLIDPKREHGKEDGREIYIPPYRFDEILTERGVIAANDRKQVRPLNRDDLEALMKENGGTCQYLRLDGLDMSGIDLRGLDLARAYLQGCNLDRAQAQPMIVSSGTPLVSSDLAYSHILNEWAAGKVDDWTEIYPTIFDGVIAGQASWRAAVLAWASFIDATLPWANLQQASLVRADFSKSRLVRVDLREAICQHTVFDRARFESVRTSGADFRAASFEDTDLTGTYFDTALLAEVKWGDRFVVAQEKQASYNSAMHIYRELARAHTAAGFRYPAGEFHFREEICKRRAAWAQLVRPQESRAAVGGEAGKRRLSLSAGLLRALLLAWFAELLFGYGERPTRVVMIAAMVVLLMSPLYVDWNASSSPAEWLKALYFSAVSFTAVGYGSWVNTTAGWQKYFGVVESFVGVSLIARALITFSRKWMR